MLDLHYQSLSSFHLILDEYLDQSLRKEVKGGVWILTGTGHHVTEGHQKKGGVLFDAVREYLVERGHCFDIGKDKGGMGGAYFVRTVSSTVE